MKTMNIAALAAILLLTGCATRPVNAPATTQLPAGEHHLTLGEVRLGQAVASHYSEPDQAELLRQLREALEEGLAVPAAESGVDDLRIDVLVTSLDEVRPSVNTLTTLLLFVPMDMGGIEFEARFYDTKGVQMAMVEHQDRSTPLDLKGSFNRFGHARNAARAWAKEMANL